GGGPSSPSASAPTRSSSPNRNPVRKRRARAFTPGPPYPARAQGTAVMRKSRITLALTALLALAACGGDATSHTGAELFGTWSIQPTDTALPGGDLRQMTVQFGPDGAFRMETATF